MVLLFVAIRRLVSGRVKAGMQRAKEEGKHVGRPPIPEDTQAEDQRLYTEEDISINKISKRLDISYGTAWNYVQEVKGE
jgi:DNA invertase Pin-like site-specific DNA recombinase